MPAGGSTGTRATGRTPYGRCVSTPGPRPPRTSACRPRTPTRSCATSHGRVGRPADEVAALLDDAAPPPRTDDELIHLAGSLAELDREVRAT